jgi:pyruvate/2-oxoglutarate dehydrogenase complex dihydrolipoamide acyltransferase (E2) component
LNQLRVFSSPVKTPVPPQLTVDPTTTESEPPIAPVPADRAIYGEGLAAVLDMVAGRMPRAEVEAVWAFPGVRRDGKEHGVVVISRRGVAERHKVYRARWVIQEKGQERGKVTVDVEETAEAPHEMLARVIAGVRDRADEAGDADVVDLGSWMKDDGESATG